MTSGVMDAYVAIACARLEQWVGIDLSRGGVWASIERHIARRVQVLGHPCPRAFAARLDAFASPEARMLVDAATVPYSWLYRDGQQWRLVERVLTTRPRGPLRILVAGAANGEDAYTAAMIALRTGHDVRVLAVDVNESALERARAGRFDAFACRELPAFAGEYFKRDATGGSRVTESLARRVEFIRHSLVDEIPRPGGGGAWDIVVCRNVLIYFGRDEARAIVRRLSRVLADDGFMVLGASDVLADLPPGLSAYSEGGRLLLVRSAKVDALVPHPARVEAPEVRPREAPREADVLDAALDRGDLAAANALLVDRLRRDPSDAQSRLCAGLAAFAEADYPATVMHLTVACREAPGAWVSFYHLALAHERLGQWDLARRAYGSVRHASGEGSDLPRGCGEFAVALRGARDEVVRLAERRSRSLEDERGTSP